VIDHLELFVADVPRATAFFRGALAPLGYTVHVEGKPVGFGASRDRLDFWLNDGGPATPRPHFAFACATRAIVDRAHRAALEAGGTDNGAPRILERIGPHYYAGFVRDPDGHNVEFVCQAPPAG